MKVQDEHGNDIGDVVSIREDGTVTIEIDGRQMTAVLPPSPGAIVRPSTIHHPNCNIQCTGDTHYLTSLEVTPESHRG